MNRDKNLMQKGKDCVDEWICNALPVVPMETNAELRNKKEMLSCAWNHMLEDYSSRF